MNGEDNSMNRGKYLRNGLKGISKKQIEVFNCLDSINSLTLEEIENILFSANQHTWSKRVWLTRTMACLKNRGLIKSEGRNSRAQHLWVKTNDN